MFKKLTGTALAGAALALAMVGPVGAANRAGDTLVNVQISDVVVAVPIAVAANLCDISVSVLAQTADVDGVRCEADAESIATPGPGNGGGGNQAGDSLVNVQIDDLFVFLPVSIAANVCDVNVNILAAQLNAGEAFCNATASSEA